jgi:hypothetical protein
LVDTKGNIDKEGVKKYVEETIKDVDWVALIERAFTKCFDEAPKYAEHYQNSTGISKAVCDFKYDMISDCIDIASFTVTRTNFLI